MKHIRERERQIPRVILPSLDEMEQPNIPSSSFPSNSGSRPRYTRTLGQFYEQTHAQSTSPSQSFPRVDIGASEETERELSPLPSSVEGPKEQIAASVLVDPNALIGFVYPTTKPLTPTETVPLPTIPSPLPRQQNDSSQKSKPTIPLPAIPSPLGKITREFEAITAQPPSQPPSLDTPLGTITATDLIAPDVFGVPIQQPQPPTSELSDLPIVSKPYMQPSHPPIPSQPLPAISQPITRPSYPPRISAPVRTTAHTPRKQELIKKGRQVASKTVDLVISGARTLLQPVTTRNLRAHIAKLESADRVIVEQFLNLKERVLPELGKQPDAETDATVAFAQYVHASLPTEAFPVFPSESDSALTSLSELLNTVVYLKESKTPGRFVGYRTDGTTSTFSLQLGENKELVCSAELPDKKIVDIFLANPADEACVELTRLASGIRQPGQREPRFSFFPSFTQTKLLQTIARQIAEISSYTPQHTTVQGQQHLQQIFLTALSNVNDSDFPIAAPATIENNTTWPAIETEIIESTTNSRHTFEAHFALEQNIVKIDSFIPSSAEVHQEENLFFTISEDNTIAITNAADEVTQAFPNLYAAARERALQLLSALTSRTRPDPYHERSPLSLETIDQLDEVLRRLQTFVLSYNPNGTPYSPATGHMQPHDIQSKLLFQQTFA